MATCVVGALASGWYLVSGDVAMIVTVRTVPICG